MGELEEDRVYRETIGKTDVYVAAALGVAVVSVSNDRIGRFRLAQRCDARDVALVGHRLVIATDEDVLVGTDDALEASEFGPAVAVGGESDVLAASPNGSIARYREGGWAPVGEVGAVRAIDGDLVAAADGVYRVEDGLEPLGLDDVVDVATGETPLAATSEGLYRFDGEWTRERAGPFRVVASDGERAHAATSAALFERSDGEWRERDPPIEETIADLGYTGVASEDGRGVVGVTVAGTCFVDPVAAKDGATGWRRRMLGLDDVTRIAVAEA